ncbi:MAG: hypothetical protein K0U38_10500 [Epsilonproteobacteria bacterium]|nr:hypothetical protein [Campylobacterota bacterium]
MKEKDELLREIEALISYNPKQASTINPNYLEYLELEDLISIKKSLLEKVGKLSQEDIEWLEQFKKFD